jgi:aquaporin Z
MKTEVTRLVSRRVPVEGERAKRGTEAAAAASYETDCLNDGERISFRDLRRSLMEHWPEYLIEATAISVFMMSACFFATLIFHPAFPFSTAIASPQGRRMVMGLMMGLTAVAIIYSPWGKRSGAHINPSVTLAFYRAGKIAPGDALFYMLAQFIGGVSGVLISIGVLGELLAHPTVNYVRTVPGSNGLVVAFIAEASISYVLMMVVLVVSNTERLSRWTGLCAGALVATFISFEQPLSGMSMNPARTFGSAVSAWEWTALWIYFTAPPLGMLLAVESYIRTKGRHRVICAKLHHQNNQRCIFRCGYRSSQQSAVTQTPIAACEFDKEIHS